MQKCKVAANTEGYKNTITQGCCKYAVQNAIAVNTKMQRNWARLLQIWKLLKSPNSLLQIQR